MDIRLLLGIGVALSAKTLLVVESPIGVWLDLPRRKDVAAAACIALLMCLTGFLWALYLHDPSVRP